MGMTCQDCRRHDDDCICHNPGGIIDDLQDEVDDLQEILNTYKELLTRALYVLKNVEYFEPKPGFNSSDFDQLQNDLEKIGE